MTTKITEFDHSVLTVNDLVTAKMFYGQVLGEIVGKAQIDEPTMLATEQLERAERLQRFFLQRDGVAHVSAPHLTVTVGDAQIPLFIQREHVQEPPPEQIRGTPRLAITVTPAQVDKAVEVFQRRDIPFEDVHHPDTSPIARSLYFKDPSSNFLELCCERSAENET